MGAAGAVAHHTHHNREAAVEADMQDVVAASEQVGAAHRDFAEEHNHSRFGEAAAGMAAEVPLVLRGALERVGCLGYSADEADFDRRT